VANDVDFVKIMCILLIDDSVWFLFIIIGSDVFVFCCLALLCFGILYWLIK